MGERHCIESAVLQISYSSEELALSQHSELEAFAKSELFSIIDEAFTEISGPDTVLWFEKLEVDLGDISLSYFFEDFGTRLKDKMRKILEEELVQNENNATGNHEKISAQVSELEIVCQFLSTGSMPWNAKFTLHDDVEDLFARVIENSGRELIAFIRGASNRNEIVSRLASQFPPKSLSALLANLADLKSDRYDDLVDQILSIAIANFDLTRNDIECRVWAEIFQFTLLNGSRRLVSKDVFARVIRVLSLHVPYRYSVFLTRFTQFAKGGSGDMRLYELMLEVTENTVGTEVLDEEFSTLLDEGDQTKLDDERIDLESRNQLLTTRARLVEAVNTGSISRLKPVWQSLRADYPEMLTEVVTTLGQSQKVRRNIAFHFLESMIRDIVEHLEPTNYRFIEQLVDEPKLYLQADEGLKLQETDARKSLWEFTLTYLLVERGSRFNKKSYIASMVSKMAANLNVEVMDLYHSLMALLEPLSKNDAMRAELLELLGELSGEAARKSNSEGLTRTPGEGKNTVLNRDEMEFGQISDKSSEHDAEASPPAGVVNALRLAFEGASLAELKVVWRLLFRQYSGWFLSTLRKLGQQASVRQNISKSFTNPMFTNVIFLIEPTHGKFISEVVLRSTTKPSSAGKRPAAPQKTKRAVREFTLSYLLIDRGSRFNKKTYLAGLLKQMAAHENVSVQSIYRSIRESMQSVVYMSSFQNDILLMLGDVAQELRIKAETDKAPGKRGIELASTQSRSNHTLEKYDDEKESDDSTKEFEKLELIRAYLLYEKLVAAIVSAGGSPGSISYHVVRLIHELIEHYPWMLHRFNQDVNAGRLSLSSIIVRLPRSLQRKLLLSFFASFSANYQFGESVFLKRLELAEGQSPSSNPIYGMILGKLIGNRIDDLEEIFDLNESALSSRSNHQKDPTSKSSHQEDLASRSSRQEDLAFKSSSQEDLASKSSRQENLASRSGSQEDLAFRSSDQEDLTSKSIREEDLTSRSSHQQALDQSTTDERDQKQNKLQQGRQAQEEWPAGVNKLSDSAPLSLNQGTADLVRAYLLGQLNLIEQDKMSIMSTLELLLSSHPSSLAQLLKESLVDKAASDRLVGILPESLLVKLMLLLRPDDHLKVIVYADLMTMAAVEAEKSVNALSGRLHLAKWQFIFNYMVIEGRRFNEVSFVRRFSAFLAERSSNRTHAEFTKHLSNRINITKSVATHVASVRIAMILQSTSISHAADSMGQLEQENTASIADRADELKTEFEDGRAFDVDDEPSAEHSFNSFEEGDDADVLEDIYIDNAGLVLLGPYLPRYFEMLGLLEGNKFKDRDASERGAHLLQYLLNESTDSFEYQLVINKLLCGVDAGTPIVKRIEITDEEKEASESLLNGIIANWPVLKNTSIEGLRESFLQREAHLQRKDDGWHLLVQTKAFDMLMDSIPWSYSIVKLGWMKRAIHVDWR